jgi:hypothetical protein
VENRSQSPRSCIHLELPVDQEARKAAPCWLASGVGWPEQTDGATFATIPTTGAATGRLGGRTVRGCRGCGGLVLRLCTAGEVQHLQSVRCLRSRSPARPYSRAHDRMHARLPLSPRHESGRRHAGRGRAPRQQAPACPGVAASSRRRPALGDLEGSRPGARRRPPQEAERAPCSL